METGFETCGNATLIAYDRGTPVLATDPWVLGRQYFGSWTLPYRFTPGQMEAFSRVTHVWLSHGHPDHLNLESLALFRDKTLLIPQHRGGRILADLASNGFNVVEIPNGGWQRLSDRIHVLCHADWNQDAALLVAIDGRCAVLNLNDGGALGTRGPLAREFSQYGRRFVLRLLNYGDADMINFFTEDGRRIVPFATERKLLGLDYAALLKRWDATHTAPFSCHHMYARTDSRWAQPCETPMEDHARGFRSTHGEFIPGYFSYDVGADRVDVTPLERAPREYHDPKSCGDDWEETLSPADLTALSAYFARFTHLRGKFEFITFRVGGRNHVLDCGGPKGRGLTFEVPRGSLMKAVSYEIFDDLLIGNFMKTTLHGGVRSLYPDFAPYVAKYGDNGRAFSEDELAAYFRAYRQEAGLSGWIDRMKAESSRRVRTTLAANRRTYLAARRVYGYLKSR